MRRASLVVALAACDASTGMQGLDAHVRRDAPPTGGDAAGCAQAPSGPFGAPVENTSLSSANFDGKPSMTADQLEVFFKSGRPDDMTVRIWHSTRATLAAPWAAPSMVTELNSNQFDTSPTISPDGLTIWFVSYRTGGPGGGDFYVSKRPNRTAGWSAPQLVSELNTTGYEDALAIDPTGRVGYFHSTRAGGMNNQIYRTTRASATDPWSTPVAVTELASTYDDANAWISADDCTIYFDSSRPGGLGQYDVFRATRPAPGARFDRVEPVTELNGAQYDADPFLSPDQRHIIYTSNRPSGDFNIYEASR